MKANEQPDRAQFQCFFAIFNPTKPETLKPKYNHLIGQIWHFERIWWVDIDDNKDYAEQFACGPKPATPDWAFVWAPEEDLEICDPVMLTIPEGDPIPRCKHFKP